MNIQSLIMDLQCVDETLAHDGHLKNSPGRITIAETIAVLQQAFCQTHVMQPQSGNPLAEMLWMMVKAVNEANFLETDKQLRKKRNRQIDALITAMAVIRELQQANGA